MEGSSGLNVKVIENVTHQLRYAGPKLRSLVAREINKAVTSGRKELVEGLMVKTKLKRKILNDRIVITRAKPDELIARLTPIYGSRIYMTTYPFETVTVRKGVTALRLTSPLYRKNMRTAFMSKDNKRMYLRPDGGGVRSVQGRSVPRLFETFKIKGTYEERMTIDAFDRISKLIVPELGL